MPHNNRTRSTLPGPGPYLAEITNHLDSTFMGGLEVVLISHTPSGISRQSNTYPVKYLSPFYGVTSSRFEGNNPEDFNDVQKSYGMWMVPPDVGTIVMVIFVNSDPNQGYWMGCVPDLFQNHMVPGIAASKQVALTPAQKAIYGADVAALPVAEFNKKANPGVTPKVDSIKKPVHPFADVLLKQGLLADNIRGVTTSGARREIPSNVFGISTPGPVNTGTNAKIGKIGYAGNTQAYVSRLGGSTFVMDDGDVDGNNELVRIRTRTGHQILLHNTSDLIYIANSQGTAWIELTSLGKIDVYAADSISFHTVQDFNFRADRDINFEAGRNINLTSLNGDFKIASENNLNFVSKNINSTAVGVYSVSADTLNAASTGQLSISSNGTVVVSGNSTQLIGKSSIDIDSTIINQYPKSSTATPGTPTTVGRPNTFAAPASFPPYTTINRIPTHEPWAQHESKSNPFTPDLTSSAINGTFTTSNGVVVPAAKSANTPQSFKAGPGVDRGMLHYVATPWTTDTAFLNKVKEVAVALGFPPIDLLSAMHLETGGTFDPSIKNPRSTATGLIQFLESTAHSLGTTTAALSQMGRVQQMDYVYQYFNKLCGWPNVKCPNPTLGNIYLTIFLPAFRFAGPNEKIAEANNPATAKYWSNNTGFDPQNLGYITPNMVLAAVQTHKIATIKELATAGLDTDFNKISS